MVESFSRTDLLLQRKAFLEKLKRVYLFGVIVFFGLVVVTPLTTSTIIFFVLAFVCGYFWMMLREDVLVVNGEIEKEGVTGV